MLRRRRSLLINGTVAVKVAEHTLTEFRGELSSCEGSWFVDLNLNGSGSLEQQAVFGILDFGLRRRRSFLIIL
jgi:hypothetical protein